jgi:hypothetical protein
LDLSSQILTTEPYPEQVETLLKTQDGADSSRSSTEKGQDSIPAISLPQTFTIPNHLANTPPSAEQDVYTMAHATMGSSSNEQFPFMGTAGPHSPANATEPFPWEMIGLGLEEPLPTADVIDEL